MMASGWVAGVQGYDYSFFSTLLNSMSLLRKVDDNESSSASTTNVQTRIQTNALAKRKLEHQQAKEIPVVSPWYGWMTTSGEPSRAPSMPYQNSGNIQPAAEALGQQQRCQWYRQLYRFLVPLRFIIDSTVTRRVQVIHPLYLGRLSDRRA